MVSTVTNIRAGFHMKEDGRYNGQAEQARRRMNCCGQDKGNKKSNNMGIAEWMTCSD
jgi:hypothetical protein